jgi:hypothetical protein
MYNCDNKNIIGNSYSIKGDYNTITGNNNVINGDYNHVIGNNNMINGDYNDIIGNSNKINGDYNKHIGKNNIATGDYNDSRKKEFMPLSSKIDYRKKFNFDGAEFSSDCTFGNGDVMNILNASGSNIGCTGLNIKKTGSSNGSSTDGLGMFRHVKISGTFSDGEFTMSNITKLRNGYIVFCRKGSSTIKNKKQEAILSVSNGELIIITKHGTFKSNEENKVLERIGDKAIVENLYVDRKLKDKTIYKSIEDDSFELILYKTELWCKNYKKFPELKLSGVKKQEKIYPKRKAEKVTDKQDISCKICFENEINTIILDCKHSCICSKCAKLDLKKCPICRKKITKGISDFFLVK